MAKFVYSTPTKRLHFMWDFQKYIQRLPSLNTKKVMTNNGNGGIDDLLPKTAGGGVEIINIEKLSKSTFQNCI